MFLEAITQRIRYRLRTGEEIQLRPGVPTEVPEAAARQLLKKANGQVRQVAGQPIPPLRPGWLVVYRVVDGRLAGGCDDRAHGTVQRCEWTGQRWVAILTDGQRLTLRAIRSVAKTDHTGQILAAFTTKEHGYDGEGPVKRLKD